MKIHPVIPAELAEFARSRIDGSYGERYAVVLDEAFFRHTILLNASNLRQLVGGGSGTTAQQAVEDFKAKLRARLNYSIDLGGGVPQEIAARFAEALDAFWGVLREESRAQWVAERTALQASLETVRANALDTERNAQTTLGLLSSTRAELEAVLIDREQLRICVDRTAQQAAATEQQLRDTLRTAEHTEKSQQAQLTQLREQLDEQAERFQRSEKTQAERHRAEQDDARKAHMLQLDGVRVQARADTARAEQSLDKAHAEITRLSAALSVSQAGLRAAEEKTVVLVQAKARSDADLLAVEADSRQALREMNEQIVALGNRLESAKAREVDGMALLAWLHDIDPAHPDTGEVAWLESSTEAHLARAVMKIVSSLPPGRSAPSPLD